MDSLPLRAVCDSDSPENNSNMKNDIMKLNKFRPSLSFRINPERTLILGDKKIVRSNTETHLIPSFSEIRCQNILKP